MIYINTPSNNPFFNLAAEEYLLNSPAYQTDIFMLWQNEPTVVVGRHQNTIEEVNQSFVTENNIHVVRRLSGGGAVYHDLGNVNFTFIKRNVRRDNFECTGYVLPIIYALNKLGVDAEFSGRNDLTIEGKKFSGNAQYFSKQDVLHHGTILFKSDVSVLAQALTVKEQKYKSKGVKSVRSRVTNVSDYLSDDISVEVFKQVVAHAVFAYNNQPYYETKLNSADCEAVAAIAAGRYQTRDWNYGVSPCYNFNQEKTFAGGTVAIYLNIQNNKIINCSIFGDFFSFGDINDITEALIGQQYKESTIKQILNSIQAEDYLHEITIDDLASCFFK